MKYFEVLYTNWHGDYNVAIVATEHETPETPTIHFNFNWSGNILREYKEITQDDYINNKKKHFKL